MRNAFLWKCPFHLQTYVLGNFTFMNISSRIAGDICSNNSGFSIMFMHNELNCDGHACSYPPCCISCPPSIPVKATFLVIFFRAFCLSSKFSSLFDRSNLVQLDSFYIWFCRKICFRVRDGHTGSWIVCTQRCHIATAVCLRNKNSDFLLCFVALFSRWKCMVFIIFPVQLRIISIRILIKIYECKIYFFFSILL